MNVHQIFDIAAYTVAGASVLYTVLPPWEQFGQWPKFQSAYQFILIFLKAVAINGRTAMSNVYGNPINATRNAGGTDSKILGDPTK
jgi:hypothetical protein